MSTNPDTTTLFHVAWTSHYPERATIDHLREHGTPADAPFDTLGDAVEWMVTDTEFDFDGDSTLPDMDTLAHLVSRGGMLIDGMFATGEPIRYAIWSTTRADHPSAMGDVQTIPVGDTGVACPECGRQVWDLPRGHKLAKCWNVDGHASGTTLAFDTMPE